MKALNAISSCRHCRYYQLEGRRGGLCQQLGVLVQGGWKACQLALPPFAPSWEIEPLEDWPLDAIAISEHFSTRRANLCTSDCGISAEQAVSLNVTEPVLSSPVGVRPQQRQLPLAPTA